MTPTPLVHVYETLCCWLACHGDAPSVRQLAAACGEHEGRVYARVWRLREMGLV